jgi:hypothetical protein
MPAQKVDPPARIFSPLSGSRFCRQQRRLRSSKEFYRKIMVYKIMVSGMAANAAGQWRTSGVPG